MKQNIKMPEFKIDVRESGVNRSMVMRFDGEILRPATDTEILKLKTLDSHTRGVLENTVKAKHGVIPWRKEFENFL